MLEPSSAGEHRIKRLFWDIETSPNVVYSWRIGYNINLSHDNIIKERKVICVCWKWEGESKVNALTWDDRQNDKKMLAEFISVANEADELVAQYGDSFDLPWFRTRCLLHGLEPLPIYKTIDTKAWASKYFYFNSNKLDYMADVMGFGKKLDTEYQLWLDVMAGSQKALDYMVKYCKVDVIRLEQVYSKLSACVRPKTHFGVFAGGDKWTCAHCGSEHVGIDKTRVTPMGTIQRQMRCKKCRRYYTISDKSYRAFLEETTKTKEPCK